MANKILVADDSPTIRKVVELTLSEEGYEVIAAGDGAQAIALLAKERPVIILADVTMPEKNGYDLGEYVRRTPELQHIPVLLLRSKYEALDEDRARRAGIAGNIIKPFESNLLIKTIAELVAGSKPAGATAPSAPATATPNFPPAPPSRPPQPLEDLAEDSLLNSAAVEDLAAGLDAGDGGDSPFHTMLAPAAVGPVPEPVADEPPDWMQAPVGARGVDEIPYSSGHTDWRTDDNDPFAEPPAFGDEFLPGVTPSGSEATGASAFEAPPDDDQAPLEAEFAAEERNVADVAPFGSEQGAQPAGEADGFGPDSVLADLPEADPSPFGEPAIERLPAHDPLAADEDAFESSLAPFRAEEEAEDAESEVTQSEPARLASAELPRPAASEVTGTSSGAVLARAATGAAISAVSLANLPEDVMNALVERVVQRMSQDVVQEVVWQIVPELAELMIKKKLEELG